MDNQKIFYAKTVYGEEEIKAVTKCLNESTQMGKNSREFERSIAKLFKKKYCLFVNSGSSALYIGVEALEFDKGSEVITPALTFSTTVGAIIKNDLVPVFADVKPLTYCINEKQIESLISDKTVAILAPNLLGNICNWIEIKRIADRFGLIVIEDSADTLGAKLDGVSSGEYCDMSITSFYGSHIINCAGNGGALAVNDKKVLNKAKLLRSWGRSSSLFDEQSESIENRFNQKIDGIDYDSKFIFEEIGYNLEGSEIGAAFGLVQLKKLSSNIKIRQGNFNKLTNFFEKHSMLFLSPEKTRGSDSGWLAFPIMISKNAAFTRKDLQIFLEKNNIQTRVIFTGNIARQPMLKGKNFIIPNEGLPNADSVMERGLLLPLHHGMTNDMFERLMNVLEDFISSYK